MDLRKLKTLIDLVSESSISELEITEAEGKVRIVKASAPAALPAVVVPPVPVAPVAAPVVVGAAPAAAPLPAHATTPAAAAEAPAGKVITSPMVGTFYRSASPGAKAFVEVGDAVKEGSPVCIIEAMKIMNEIESEVSGTVAKVLCENGQAVEYGQPLFILE
ncbi:MAG: Biotin carboxyl carrier protein of acetyl-CoA carboxylase [Pseudomonadota bacterium]|jgi:acetyl-CoA carboxylase biotin carboxyl carrier protein